MADNTDKSTDVTHKLLMDAAEAAVGQTVKVLIGPAGSAAFTVLSRTGKTLFSIWMEKRAASLASGPDADRVPGKSLPPFAIIGLGRCGTHITAHLARMVLESLNRKPNASQARYSFLTKLFSKEGRDPKFTVEPLMIVGDLDPSTLDEIRGLISISKDGQFHDERDGLFRRILKINYDPLSVSGAGHLPIVAQFMTRCLLALPPKPSADGVVGWQQARTYLLDYTTREANPTRMVFYVFSAGGGSGSGSSAELMRAQRLAIVAADNPDPEMYFCGFAVLPYDQRINKIHRVNTGRFFVQYLADLGVRLPDNRYYYRALEYDYTLKADAAHSDRPIEPWNGLAVVSNDTLRAMDTDASKEEIDQNVNQYVAQQIFNLASGQISVLEYERTEDISPSLLNFQSVRMDPADLKNGLVGPFAVGFAVADTAPTQPKTSWIDSMILRTLMSPQLNESYESTRKTGFIQGLSISPQELGSKEQQDYDEAITSLYGQISDKASTGLTKESVSFFSKIGLFRRCPKVIFVFTAPQAGIIPGNVDRRIAEVLSWLMPNLNQARYAVVRGTTEVFTLSIFMQGSVVLCSEVLDSIRDYLYLCWKTRSLEPSEFEKLWESFMYDAPNIDEAQVRTAFGESEDLGPEFERFDQSTKDSEQKWQSVLNGFASLVGEDLAQLRSYSLDSCLVNFREVASALRYLRYVHNVEARHGLKPVRLR